MYMESQCENFTKLCSLNMGATNLQCASIIPIMSPADITIYTLSEAWSGVNWADLMAAQGPIFMTGL